MCLVKVVTERVSKEVTTEQTNLKDLLRHTILISSSQLVACGWWQYWEAQTENFSITTENSLGQG